jgi:hypothetical protein
MYDTIVVPTLKVCAVFVRYGGLMHIFMNVSQLI